MSSASFYSFVSTPTIHLPIGGAKVNPVILGASGCPLKPEYGDTLLAVGGKTGTFTYAGAGDEDFAGKTGAYMEEPSLETKPIPEPEFAKQAKLVNN